MIRVIRIAHQNLSPSCCCIHKGIRKKKAKTASKVNTQPSTEYYSVPMRIILI